MKLLHFLFTGLACQAIATAGITTSGSVLTLVGAPYDGSDPWVIGFGALNVGSAASFGSLEISAGSEVFTYDGINIVSPASGLSSSVLVDGIGSGIMTDSAVFVDAGGVMRLRNGATGYAEFLVSRSLAGRAAQTFIEGDGTVFNAGKIEFYGNGTSAISVTNGGTLYSLGVQSESISSSNYVFTIGGGSGISKWLESGFTTIGGAGRGLVEVKAGAYVDLGSVAGLTLGAEATGSGIIRVDGTEGIALARVGRTTIGLAGTGSMVVTNGGKVTAGGLNLRVGDSVSGGSGQLRVGGGEKVSTLDGKTELSVSGSGSLIEVLENGILEAGKLGIGGGSRVVVGGGSGPAVLNVSPGSLGIFQSGLLSMTGGSRLDILQGGTLTASLTSVSDTMSRVSLDGGTIKAAGYLGGLPVQVLAGGGTIQTPAGNWLSMGDTTGVGLLTKTGAGVLNFEGQINHAGTRVLEGSLNLAAGSRTTGTVEILAGAKLTGTGTLDGLLTLQQGAVIAPGNRFFPDTLGILQTGSSVWMSGGRYEWEINNFLGNQGINWDLVQINGSLDLVGLSPSDPFVIAIQSLFSPTRNPGAASGFDPLQGYRFTILTTTSGITGFDPSDFRLDLTGFANADLGDAYWALQEWNNGLDLVYNFAPVPEPGSVMFIAATALAALAQRRRRLRKCAGDDKN